MSKLTEQIGLRLRAVRRAASFKSARNFAFQHNIPGSTYSQHETGKRSLNPDMLLRYSEILNINPGWLLTGEGLPYLLGDKDKEKFISQEIENLKKYTNVSTTVFSVTKNRLALVDMELFTDILRETVTTFSNDNINLNCEEVVEFCIDVYNSVVKTHELQRNRKAMIKSCISSLKRGIDTKS